MIKPILFNTEMIQAILEGRKTTTRRIVKGLKLADENVRADLGTKWDYKNSWCNDLALESKAPYHVGNILYVRETWKVEEFYDDEALIRKKANCREFVVNSLSEQLGEKLFKFASKDGWQPSLFMPKEIADIFLEVTNVRVERLQDITEEGCFAEGVDWLDERCYENNGWHPTFSDPDSGGNCIPQNAFKCIWNSTVNKKDIDKYGWNANPYVWVIEFERCDKPNEF